jgi:hypothetical protein
MALKSAFLGCESIDGRDLSHSCAISMSTSSAKVFFSELVSQPRVQQTIFFLHVLPSRLRVHFHFVFKALCFLSCMCSVCLSLSPTCTLFQIQWGRTRGFRVYGPETLNLKTLKTKRDRGRVSKFVLVSLAYQGKDIVFRFIVEYSSLRDYIYIYINKDGNLNKKYQSMLKQM